LGIHSDKLKILATETIPKWGKKPEIESGILQQECEMLNDQFRQYLATQNK